MAKLGGAFYWATDFMRVNFPVPYRCGDSQRGIPIQPDSSSAAKESCNPIAMRHSAFSVFILFQLGTILAGISPPTSASALDSTAASFPPGIHRILVFEDGRKYEGETISDVPSGFGVWMFPGGGMGRAFIPSRANSMD